MRKGEYMTRDEWLDIGYDKGIIDLETFEDVQFKDLYKMWFLMKLRAIREQSCDRIEVTYNRYYKDTSFVEKYTSKITDKDIVDFLTGLITSTPEMTYRELGRIMQIVNNVLVYGKDMHIGGVKLHDWDCIKRYLPMEKLNTATKKELAMNMVDVDNIIYSVVHNKVYHTKQSACLALCMNFYLGLRVGELASLTWNDFDFEKNVVKIWKTESKFYNRDEDGSKIGCMVYRVVDNTKTVYSVREIPILPEVKYFYDLIKQHHEQNKYNSPFLCYDGKDAIMVRSLDRTLRKLCMLCDVKHFNTHMIRKMFATMLHHSNVPTRIISDLLGHSEIGTTENSYILSFDNNYREIYNYMQSALNYNKKRP